ncbi:MAG: ATP synthase F1 subunit epsilon [Acidobacteria bacterium CG_4_9_14_3_um_filter_49_7]|nr:MAG: ATP synthase F1 subunit epsilon [Acidobacteria bacterium CG_4_9_14_3_um_filter_49_7]
MSDSIAFALVSPDRSLFDEKVREVTIPAGKGEMQALPLHTPLIAKLGVGELSCTLVSGTRKRVVVSGGFVEVLPDRVTVLVRTAELPEEIDAKRAQDALNRAEQMLLHPDDDTDVQRARMAFTRASVRLRVARHL